ncbi:MAG: hypothetical protein IJB71_05425 [Bacilli bacterium]|nr:hypothetical protein [Bacilli bacterium]
MKNNNKILYISIAILVLAVGLVIGTIAYYQTTISGTITGTVAKWSFKANNQTSTFNLDFGSLYPGKTGTYNLELSAEDSALDVYYEFIVHGHNNDSALLQTLTRRIFFDDAYTLPLYGDDSAPYVSYVGAAGFIEAGEKITIPLYYNWPYDGQIDNPSYADGTLKTLPISIVGMQDPQIIFGTTNITEAGPLGILFGRILTYNAQENQIIPILGCGPDSFGHLSCGNYEYTRRDDSSVWITH